MIGVPTLADAILDRIVHNAYRLELSGESLRKRQTSPKIEALLTNPDNPNIINFDLWKRAASGRHQIGTMAASNREQVAGFLLECVAGFVGIRTP